MHMAVVSALSVSAGIVLWLNAWGQGWEPGPSDFFMLQDPGVHRQSYSFWNRDHRTFELGGRLYLRHCARCMSIQLTAESGGWSAEQV